MASTHSIESTTVRTIRDESDFAFLLGAAMERDGVIGDREGLLQLLDWSGLTEDMVDMVIVRALSDEDYKGMTEQYREGTIRICLRLIALHRTTLRLNEPEAVDISIYLYMVIEFTYGSRWTPEESFVEMLHNEHFIPFIFETLRTLTVEMDRKEVAELACLMINGLSSHRVTLLVRYWPLLPDIFMACFEAGYDRCDVDPFPYGTLSQRECAGLIATTPSLLAKLLTALNDSRNVNLMEEACEVLVSLLTTPSPHLLEHLLGCGLLTALVSFHARYPRYRAGDEDIHDAATIRAVLAAYPCWTQAVKRIAEGAVEEDNGRWAPGRANAVIEMAKALPSRDTTAEVEYNLL